MRAASRWVPPRRASRRAVRTVRQPKRAGPGRSRSSTRPPGTPLVGSVVTSTATAATLRVEVTGRALSVLPGVPGLPVRQRAEGPIERFTAP